MPDESKPPTLYKGQKNTPFFHLGKKSEISLDNVIDILLKEHSAQYVCHKQPMHVQQNAIFSAKKLCSIVMSGENSHQSLSHSVNSGGDIPDSSDVRNSVVG